MSPLGSVGALHPVDRAALPSVAGGAGSKPTQASNAGLPSVAASKNRTAGLDTTSALSLISPQATIRQAEMLLQVALTAASSASSSPVLRQIATAAYQMEIDARREMSHLRTDATKEWFA